MKAELIHIQCGAYNGIVNYKIGDKILRFELGTPNYNDYGEYRVSTEFEPIDFNENYIGYIPTNIEKDIELSDSQVKWWFDKDSEILEYMEDGQVAGGKNEENEFLIIKNRNIIKFSDWKLLEHDPYEHFMFNVLNVFFHWFRSEDFKPVGSLSIFLKL